jgi:hypothetical protein
MSPLRSPERFEKLKQWMKNYEVEGVQSSPRMELEKE